MIEELPKITEEHYQYTYSLSELDCIKSEKVNIAICKREVVDDLNTYLNELIHINFSSLKITTDINDFETLFDAHFKTLSAKYTLGHQLLKNDIQKLINQFAEISNSSNVKIFFGLVDTDMCRRFHVDMYELRMLCTYQGKGTLWLTDDNINYTALNNNESNEQIALRESDIKQLNAQDVGIIKGALYPDSKTGGLVHRSPAIENINQKRIVLRVDGNSLFDSI